MIKQNANRKFCSSRNALALACSAAIASTFVTLPTLAQDGVVTLEEVIVTARKRDESLQEVAVSVSAIGAELEQATIRRLDVKRAAAAPRLSLFAVLAPSTPTRVSTRRLAS